MKTDLKINYTGLEVIASKIEEYREAIENIDEAIERLDRVLTKQESKSTKKLSKKISKMHNDRSELINTLEKLEKLVHDYTDDMSKLAPCKTEGVNTRVDSLDIKFNLFQIRCSKYDFKTKTASTPLDKSTYIYSADPKNAETNKKMKANYEKIVKFHESRILPTLNKMHNYYDELNDIYENVISEYENTDDVYQTRMNQLYNESIDSGQRWKDFGNKVGSILDAFSASFVRAFALAFIVELLCVAFPAYAVAIIIIAMVAVPLGQSAISYAPDSAFDWPLLRDIKNECNATKDDIGKMCNAAIERGPIGILEVIGQDLEDNCQTEEGYASLFGSVAGSVMGGKFAQNSYELYGPKKLEKANFEAVRKMVNESELEEIKDPKMEMADSVEGSNKGETTVKAPNKFQELSSAVLRKIDDAIDKEFMERANSTIREKMSGGIRGHYNTGYAEAHVTGLDKTTYFAHSRVNSLEDLAKKYPPETVKRAEGISTLPPEDERVFEALKVNTENVVDGKGAYYRYNDTEYKILNEIATRIGDNPEVSGHIKMYSDLKSCPSCQHVIKQFQARYPKIKVEVIYKTVGGGK